MLEVGSAIVAADWGECEAVIREIGDTATPDEISDEIGRRVSEIDAARRALAEQDRRAQQRARRPWGRAQRLWSRVTTVEKAKDDGKPEENR